MFFPYSKWLSTPLSVRIQIANRFKIEKKGSIEVFNNEVVKDGYAIKDIEDKITLNSLQESLGTNETDPHVLWDFLMDKLSDKEIPQITSVVSPEEVARMNKEYEDRTGKIAPTVKTKEEEPLNIDTLAQTVNENANTPTLSDAIKKKGRPKGSKKVNGEWVYPKE